MDTQKFDLERMEKLDGIELLQGAGIPQDLKAKTNSKLYKIDKFYQVDDLEKWKEWKKKLGPAKEKWLFFGCPLDLAEKAVSSRSVLPYGSFFPRICGPDAHYLFDDATQAARAALKFGVESRGLLFSCRIAPGKAYNARHPAPRAEEAPSGFDYIQIPKGVDMGFGVTNYESYAFYDNSRILPRYISVIKAWK